MVVVDGYAVPKKWTYTLVGEEGVPGLSSPDLVAHFEVRDGIPECVALHVTAKRDGRGVRTADMQLFNLEQLTQRTFLEVAHPLTSRGFAPIENAEQHREAANTVQERVEGKRPTPRALLLEVARVYLEDRSGAPLNAVALRLGGPEKRRTAARRVGEARAAGLIPPKGSRASDYDRAREAVRRELEASDDE